MMDQIVPRLWVGTREDCTVAGSKGFKTMCVLEKPCFTHNSHCEHHQIIKVPGLAEGILMDANNLTKEEYRKICYVEPTWLERTLAKIDEWYDAGHNVLVHCAAGAERSPLTCTMWLIRRSPELSFDLAFNFVRQRRPIAQDRRMWLR